MTMKSFVLKARKAEDLSQQMDIKIQPPDSIYIMGICGTAMASLAVHLQQEGFSVSGSDQHIYPPMSFALQKAGIPVAAYNTNNIKNSIKLLIVGNVISRNHPEILASQKLKIPCLSFPEFLQQTVLGKTKNIVITGTHGKSTCSALMAHVGEAAGQNPGFFIGALPNNFNSSFRSTGSPFFVIEGDEYDSAFFAKKPKFFYYNPFSAFLTGIEFDHGDIYNSLEEITDLFCEFVQLLSKEGRLIACIHNRQLEKVVKYSRSPVITYGMDRGDWTIKNRRVEKSQQVFDVCYQQETYPCSFPLLGEHNALNALGVFVLSYQLGWPVEKIQQGFKTFRGLRRRLEFKGYFQGAKIYEDFAHHPTAVQAGLTALKERYPERRLIALFEPRSFTTRLSVFQKDYVPAFDRADLIFIAPAYDSSKISKEKRFSPQQLAQELERRGKTAFYYARFDDLEKAFVRELNETDVAVFMSSGAFGGLLQKVEAKFS